MVACFVTSALPALETIQKQTNEVFTEESKVLHGLLTVTCKLYTKDQEEMNSHYLRAVPGSSFQACVSFLQQLCLLILCWLHYEPRKAAALGAESNKQERLYMQVKHCVPRGRWQHIFTLMWQ